MKNPGCWLKCTGRRKQAILKQEQLAKESYQAAKAHEFSMVWFADRLSLL